MSTKLSMSEYTRLYSQIEKTIRDGILDPSDLEIEEEDIAAVIQRILFICGYDTEDEQEEV